MPSPPGGKTTPWKKLGNKHASTTDQWISSPSLTFHTIQPLWRVLQTCIHSERCACVLQYKQLHEYPPSSFIGTSWPTHNCMHALLCIRCYIVLTSKHEHCYIYRFIPCSHIVVLGSQILIYTEQTWPLWIALSVLLCHLFWSWCMYEIPENSQGSPPWWRMWYNSLHKYYQFV